MRRHNMPEVKEGGVNVTPLIDVVMVLIVFFMLVAKVGVVTGAEDIQPPATILGVNLKDMGNTLILNVREIPGGTQPLVTAMIDKADRAPKEVKLTLPNGDRPLERALAAARKANPNLKVIILGERDVPYAQLEWVLMAVAKADIRDINFQTKRRNPPERARTPAVPAKHASAGGALRPERSR